MMRCDCLNLALGRLGLILILLLGPCEETFVAIDGVLDILFF